MKNTAESSSLNLNLNLWIIVTICTSIHCERTFFTGIVFAHLVKSMVVQNWLSTDWGPSSGNPFDIRMCYLPNHCQSVRLNQDAPFHELHVNMTLASNSCTYILDQGTPRKKSFANNLGGASATSVDCVALRCSSVSWPDSHGIPIGSHLLAYIKNENSKPFIIVQRSSESEVPHQVFPLDHVS